MQKITAAIIKNSSAHESVFIFASAVITTNGTDSVKDATTAIVRGENFLLKRNIERLPSRFAATATAWKINAKLFLNLVFSSFFLKKPSALMKICHGSMERIPKMRKIDFILKIFVFSFGLSSSSEGFESGGKSPRTSGCNTRTVPLPSSVALSRFALKLT